MTKASDNAFPSILITEGTEPSAPAAGKQRVYIDSTSHHLSRTDSAGAEVDIEAAAGNPTGSAAKATANASLAANNTWQDITGASLSLAAGNWLVWGFAHFLCVNGTAVNVGLRITDGTNHYASNGATGGTGASMARTGSLAAGPVLITLAGTTTIKLQAVVDAGTTNTVIEKALTVNGVGDNATGIAAIKVA